MMDSQIHKTASFPSDPSVQNPSEAGLGLGLGLGLGFEFTNKTTPFCSNQNVENPSAKNDDYDYDDEKAERIINEELRNLVLNQAISEGRSVSDQDKNGENPEMGDWGGYENGKWNENVAKEGRYNDHNNDISERRGVLDREENGENLEMGEWGGYENGEKLENWSENGNVNEYVAKEGRYHNYNYNDDNNNYDVRKIQYPIRPDAEDCAYYMKTGNCRYGVHCKFNHPPLPIPRLKFQGPNHQVKPREENLGRPGQIECKYYLTSGGCKYGKACKYNHSREKCSVAPTPEFNFLGLPMRPGEKECSYYMRNGSCMYGSNCRFHHPDPTAVAGADPFSGYGNGGSLPGASRSSVSSRSSPRGLNNTAPFVPMMFPPSQGLPSTPEWIGYQAPVYPPSERSLPTPPAFTMNNLATETDFHSRHQQQMLVEEFPERPGQPECSYFLKTGDCKYKSNCKFHHPKSRITKSTVCALSDKGLPLRPDQPVCTFYNRYGICKYGPSCKFDHPENLGNAVPSAISNFEQSSFINSATSDGTRLAREGNGGVSLVQQRV